jgi:hypothetical protein
MEGDDDAAPVVPNKKKPRDSVSGGCVTDQQLSLAPQLFDAHEKEALHCYATREPDLMAGTTRTGKKVRLDVTVENFQCGFVLLDYAHLHAKPNHVLPFNFFARLWQKLYGMGHFPRQFPGYDPSGEPIGLVTDYYARKVEAFFAKPDLWMEHFA